MKERVQEHFDSFATGPHVDFAFALLVFSKILAFELLLVFLLRPASLLPAILLPPVFSNALAFLLLLASLLPLVFSLLLAALLLPVSSIALAFLLLLVFELPLVFLILPVFLPLLAFSISLAFSLPLAFLTPQPFSPLLVFWFLPTFWLLLAFWLLPPPIAFALPNGPFPGASALRFFATPPPSWLPPASSASLPPLVAAPASFFAFRFPIDEGLEIGLGHIQTEFCEGKPVRSEASGCRKHSS